MRKTLKEVGAMGEGVKDIDTVGEGVEDVVAPSKGLPARKLGPQPKRWPTVQVWGRH